MDAILGMVAWVTGHQLIFINLYRSGWFHRVGKPNTLDRHAGDCYTSRALALADIEPRSHYVATVAVLYRDPDGKLKCNRADSKPVPLSVSRRREVAGGR